VAIAYAEIYVTDTLWPDFRCAELYAALIEYQKRDGRYGGLASVGRGENPRQRKVTPRAASLLAST